MNKISVIIVSWNTRKLTLDCLESIRNATHSADTPEVEVIVVDNASGDGTVAAVRERYPQIILIESGGNLGFGRANNLGIERATGDLVFFLNSDTLVQPGIFRVLLHQFMAESKLGVLGCRLVGMDGLVQKSVRGHPRFRAFLYSDTVFKLLPFMAAGYERYRQKNFDFSRAQEVETVMGAAMLVPRAILAEVGGFDPRFFMYFEEADLCRRIGEAGYLVKYTPDAVVIHLGGASSDLARSRMFLVYRQSMFAYFRKHEGSVATGFFASLFKPLFILQTLFSALADGAKALAAIVFDKTDRYQKYRQRCHTKMKFLTRDLAVFVRS